jgi:hypothetical protein
MFILNYEIMVNRRSLEKRRLFEKTEKFLSVADDDCCLFIK